MTCEEVLPLMHREVDGDLAPDERKILFHHLSACLTCQTEFQRLQELSRQLESLPQVEPPKSVVEQMVNTVGNDGAGTDDVDRVRPQRKSRRYWWYSGLATAAVFLLIVWLNNDVGPDLTHSTDEQIVQQTMEESAEDANAYSAGEADDAQRSSEDGAVSSLTEYERPFEEQESFEQANAASTQVEHHSPVGPLQEKEEYLSPDSTYAAYIGVENEDIRIDQEDQPHFLWVNPHGPSWQVEWLEWVTNDELYVVLLHPEHEMRLENEREHWLIDASERDVQQLDGPHPQSTQDVQTEREEDVQPDNGVEDVQTDTGEDVHNGSG